VPRADVPVLRLGRKRIVGLAAGENGLGLRGRLAAEVGPEPFERGGQLSVAICAQLRGGVLQDGGGVENVIGQRVSFINSGSGEPAGCAGLPPRAARRAPARP